VLLAALSLFITPKELLHEFTKHADSVDVICHNECSQHVETEHQHCDVLQLSSPPLHLSVNTFSFSHDELLSVQSFENTGSYHFSSSAFLFFRGPPAIS
jgi:hypothetical protein